MKKSIGSGRGSVYNILLKALQSGDKYGYEICKEIEEKSNGTYILKQPSLYSGLKRLEAQKLITSYWKDSDLGGRRHYYSLTPAGSQKIENSNFSWEDTRDNLVNSLFEKSELENDLDDVVKQVDTLKQQTEEAKQYQQDIDEIISSTQNLVEKNEINNDCDEQKQEDKHNSTTDLFAYGNSDDLFSMFGSFGASKQTEDTQENANVYGKDISNDIDEDVKEDDQVDNEEGIKVYNIEDYQEDTNQSAPLDKNNNGSGNNNESDELSSQTQTDLSIQTEDNNAIEDQSDLLNEVESDSLNETEIAKENVENSTKDGNLNNTQLDLFSYINNAPTNNTSIDDKIDEEEKNDEQNFDEIIKNFTTYETANELENIQPENELNEKEFETENIKELEAEKELLDDDTVTFNTVKNNFEEAINEQTNHGNNLNQSKTQTNKTEINDEEVALQKNDEKDFLSFYKNNHMSTSSFADNSKFETVEKSYFNDSENVFDIDSFNLNSNTSNNFDEPTNIGVANEDLLETEQSNLPNENQNGNQSSSAIDYANIFGDLMTSNKNAESVASESEEIDDNLKEDLQVTQKNNQNNTNTGFVDELPRINTNQNNINRTLMVDQNMLNDLNEQYNEENPFEKLDSKIKEQFDENTEVEQNNAYNQNSFKERNIPFDRKFGHVLDNFEIPDYQVRYYKKSTSKAKTSKFISINKLNLVSSIIISILLCVLTTAILICSSLKVSPNGTQIACYALSYVAIIFMLMFNLLKYQTNKNKKILELNKNQIITNSFFAVVLIILTIALNILFGMNLTNILDYSASFILPLCYSLILFIQPLVKKFLSRFSGFYLN